MRRPRVYEAAGVPAEIEDELASAFEIVPTPVGADGIVVTPAVPVDPVTWAAPVVTLLVAVLVAGAGLVGLRRRDLLAG